MEIQCIDGKYIHINFSMLHLTHVALHCSSLCSHVASLQCSDKASPFIAHLCM